ncbi:hypothetical protein GCM10027299_09390 [Larkinella ripae]
MKRLALLLLLVPQLLLGQTGAFTLPKKAGPVSGTTRTLRLPRNAPASTGTSRVFSLSKIPVIPEIPPVDADTLNSFVLLDTSNVSFGAFRGDTLIKTIASGLRLPPGKYRTDTLWDGLGEDSLEVVNGTYQIKALVNNVTAEFQGTVGNTSLAKSGNTVWHSGNPFTSFAVPTGNYFYAGVGYAENEPGHFKGLKTNIQERINVIPTEGMVVRYIDYDGSKVYWAGQDHSPSKFGVIATNLSNDAQASLAGGVSQTWQQTVYSSVIFQSTPITGLAVQKTGNYYFVSDSANNRVISYHKTVNSPTSYTITNPQDGVCDAAGNLWLIYNTTSVGKFTVTGGVISTTPVVTLSGLVSPRAIDISPDGSTIAIGDAGTRQTVRRFSTTTGAETTQLGRPGGYYVSSTVEDDRFMFFNPKDIYKAPEVVAINYGGTIPWLSYTPEGTLWVGDAGNARALHFNTADLLTEYIQQLGFNYSVQVNLTDSSRVYSNYLEFKVDYSKPFGPNTGAWKLSRNWAAGVTQAMDDQYIRMKNTITYSNGLTYCFFKSGTNLQLYELVAGGNVRPTGIIVTGFNWRIMPDGSLLQIGQNTVGTSATITRRLLTGYSGNNPVYANPITVVNSPALTVDDPASGGGGHKTFGVTASGKYYIWSHDRLNTTTYRGRGYHLGFIRSTKWLAKTAKATYLLYQGNFPRDGRYEIGNSINNAGSFSQALDNLVIYGFQGENWKVNQSGQTNIYTVYHDSGLFVSTFGVTGLEANESGNRDAYPGMAGNANNGGITRSGNNYYLYHADEFWRGGISRWELLGLKSVKLITRDFVKSGSITMPAKPYVDLMAGLPRNDTLRNNTAGWTRFPEKDTINTALNRRWMVVTRRTTYLDEENDLLIVNRPLTNGLTTWVKRSLSGSTQNNWTITGKFGYPEVAEQFDNFIDVLDNNDRVITRISRPQGSPATNMSIQLNGNVVVSGNNGLLGFRYSQNRPFSIKVNGSVITMVYDKYPPVTTTVFDPLANPNRPTTLRFQSYSATQTAHQLSVANLRLYTNLTQ